MAEGSRLGSKNTVGRVAYAHSANAEGQRQELRDHLEAVSDLASGFAAAFGSSELARAAGLWHDIGKFHPEFQRYLLESEAGSRARGTGPDHKGAGVRLAAQRCEPLAFLIAGHHGGLPDRSELKERVQQWLTDNRTGATLELTPSDIARGDFDLRPPATLCTAHEMEMYLRVLFSTLVDADYLDTERHFSPESARSRGGETDLALLWSRFEQSRDSLERRDDTITAVREEVYEACLQAAHASPGFFRLTVPTGGGKTLSSMAFALQHALRHGMRRVVVAVPFTTITEQTADVYRNVFGEAGAVLEHHSNIRPQYVDEQTAAGLWSRLAAENWDAPVVVTTTVQLFESLFAAGTSKCRKLHRLAGSVIILDEVQSIPTHVLDPILDGLRFICGHLASSVVLCTATQPSLDEAPGFRGLLNVREIVADPPRLYSALRRVDYDIPSAHETWSWERVAREMGESEQVLTIANTIRDAHALLDALDDPEVFHLSTRLCGAHRRHVLAQVRRRLHAGQPCKLVSTQVVEAGVDIDFPLVLRAVGPLDRIVQAAGRCNREGFQDRGRVVIFRPADGHLPPGSYRTATDQAATFLAAPNANLHDPDLYQRYFRTLYAKLDLDTEHIQELRAEFRFEQVSKKFKLIHDDTQEVVVRFDEAAARLIDELQDIRVPNRRLMRRLQPYMVSIRTRDVERCRASGLIAEIPMSGILLWLGAYDMQRGLTEEHDVLLV